MDIDLRQAIWAQGIRVRRSVVPWMPPVAAGVVGVVFSVAFLLALVNPSHAQALGTIRPDGWAGFIVRIVATVVIAGVMVFGSIAVWLFAREFVRRAEPLASRWTVTGAIVVIALHWSLRVVFEISVVVLTLGALISAGYLSPIGSDRTSWAP